MAIAKRIILAAGHGGGDAGAVAQGTTEAIETIQITSKVVNLLRADKQVEVVLVPDALGLTDTINWINARHKQLEDGIAVEIHKNSGGGTGSEVWTPSNPDAKSLSQAMLVANAIARNTGLRNRGVKQAQDNRWGRLGFCDDTNTYAMLIEANFIDVDSVSDAADNKLARGIFEGLLACFGLSPRPTTPPVPPVKLVSKQTFSPAKTFVVSAETRLVNFPKGDVKSGSHVYKVGEKIENVVELLTYSNGLKFYRTKYARDVAKASYGFRNNTIREYVAPAPAQPKVVRTKQEVYATPRRMVVISLTNLAEIPSGKSISGKNYSIGTIIEDVKDYQEFSNGQSFYRTQYSHEKNASTGFLKASLKEYVEPKEPETPQPSRDDVQDAEIKRIKDLLTDIRNAISAWLSKK